jgi:predicted kinase
MKREELGIDPVFPCPSLMKEALYQRDEEILQALKEGRSVICSDTNLTAKARRRLTSLAKQAGVKEEVVDFTHVSISTCIERDRLRGMNGERCVGKEVILSMASSIREDECVKEEKVLVIGDIHGDYKKLISLLSRVKIKKKGDIWSNPMGLKVVFLGDLNDPRLNNDKLNRTYMSSIKTIQIVKELWEQGIGELIQSNHQLNLINLWRGKRKSLAHGLKYTKEEIDKKDRYEVDKLILWLSSRPYYYKFKNKGKEYVCVHAYYTSGMSQYHPNEKEKNDCLYGPRKGGSRYQWWKEYDNASLFVIAGHYHVVDKGNNYLILDGDCGTSGGQLFGYLVDQSKIISARNN